MNKLYNMQSQPLIKVVDQNPQQKCAEIYRDSMSGTYCFICFNCGGLFKEFVEIYKHIEDEHYKEFSEQIQNTEFIEVASSESMTDLVEVKKELEDNGQQEDTLQTIKCEANVEINETNESCSNSTIMCDEDSMAADEINNESNCSNEKMSYSCDFCKQAFAKKSQVLIHYTSSHPNILKDLKCKLCSYVAFNKKRYLRQHIRTYHQKGDETISDETEKDLLKEKTYSCDFCKEIFPKMSLVLEHFKLSHPNKLEDLKCKYCPYMAYNKRRNLTQHIRLAHPLKSISKGKDYKRKAQNFFCAKCNKCYTRKSTLLTHILSHLEVHSEVKKDQEFICILCKQSFAEKSQLLEHFKTHPDNLLEDYKCKFCPFIVHIKRQLRSHVRIYHPEEYVARRKYFDEPKACDVCGKIFHYVPHYDQHMAIHLDLKLHKCDVCDKGFNLKRDLFIHYRCMHTDRKSTHICPICQRTFKNSTNLRRHNIVHTGEKPFKCDLCPQRFTVQLTAIRHQKAVHNNERSYQCYICGLKFVCNGKLNTHIKFKHSNREKKHQCSVCEKKFFTEYSLKKHHILHSGLRQFHCDVCGKDFATKDALRNHKYSHMEKRYKCNYCDMKFIQICGRRVHEKGVHNAV